MRKQTKEFIVLSSPSVNGTLINLGILVLNEEKEVEGKRR